MALLFSVGCCLLFMFVCLVVPIGLRLVGYVGCCRFSVDVVSFVSVY